MISLHGIRLSVLDIGSLEIPPGITSVIGPNGSGKTTLLKLLTGITLPESGMVLVDNIQPRQAEIGWVDEFPDRNILFGTVADEVASSLRFRRRPCRDTDACVDARLLEMGILSLRDRPVMELSGGEKILVALAAALIHHPRVLILDECDSHFDDRRARDVNRIVRMSKTPYIIRCTQNMETAVCSDRIVYLEKGRVVHTGTPQEVFASLAGTAFYPISMRCRI